MAGNANLRLSGIISEPPFLSESARKSVDRIIRKAMKDGLVAMARLIPSRMDPGNKGLARILQNQIGSKPRSALYNKRKRQINPLAAGINFYWSGAMANSIRYLKKANIKTKGLILNRNNRARVRVGLPPYARINFRNSGRPRIDHEMSVASELGIERFINAMTTSFSERLSKSRAIRKEVK